MKYIFFLILAYCCLEVFGQISLPVFLEGTWKVKDNEIYEHWDKLNDNKLKGLSYRLTDGKMIVSEYLDIRRERKKITYSASVLNQNQGKEVQFNLSQTDDSTWIFSNANHDFPKKIIYKKMNDLGIEELKQLLTFYKQKSSELEFTLLQSELKINKLNAFKTQIEEAEKTKNELTPAYQEPMMLKIRSNEVLSHPEAKLVNRIIKEKKENNKKGLFGNKSKKKTEKAKSFIETKKIKTEE
jgi:hypothetical protein